MTLLEEIRAELEVFQDDWANEKVRHLLPDARATSVGWKVADLEGFLAAVVELIPSCNQLHIGTVNNRKIGSFVVDKLPLDIRVVKLMQRRPGSNDQLGFDHVDFTVPDLLAVEATLIEQGTGYEWQANDAHRWMSVPTDSGEIKIIDHSVLAVCAHELTATEASILEKQN